MPDVDHKTSEAPAPERMVARLMSSDGTATTVSDSQMRRIEEQSEAWTACIKEAGGSVHLLKGRISKVKATLANKRLLEAGEEEDEGDEAD